MAIIPILGLPDSDAVPGNYIDIRFGVGAASGGQNTYPVLLVGNKSTVGSATADTVVYGPNTSVSLTSETDAIALFGAGSELHRMVKAFLAVNTSTPLYALAVTESTGVAATGTLTLTGTATASGTLRVQVGAETVDVGFVSGDTPTVIAAAAVIAVNSQTSWAVTASNAAGVITLTNKVKGLRGNSLRFSARVLPSSGTSVSVSPSAQTAMNGGTVADVFTTALTTIAATRFYNIVSASGYEGGASTQFSALVSQVSSQALPVNGIRQRCFTASVDTLANTTTFAQAINAVRAEIIWLQNSDVIPAELSASVVAVYALEESSTPAVNFSGYGNDANSGANWKVPQPTNVAGPTRNQLVAALKAGITPIAVSAPGRTYLVKRCTSYSLNGSNPDTSIRDAHKVTVCDRFADDAVSKFQSQFSGKLLGTDPVPGQTVQGQNVVTPRAVKAAVSQLAKEYFQNGLVENLDSTIAQMVVVRETSAPNRISIRVPLDVINLCEQICMELDQVG